METEINPTWECVWNMGAVLEARLHGEKTAKYSVPIKNKENISLSSNYVVR